jgi:hypothetical protein
MQSYCDNLDKENAKLAYFMDDTQYRARNYYCKGSGIKLKNFKKEAKQSVLYTVMNSFLYDTFRHIMDKLVPAGIPQYLVKYHEYNMFKEFHPSTSSTVRVLSVQDLEHGFVLWLGACVISTIGFLIELLRFYGVICLKNMIGLWMLITNLKKYLKNLSL